MRAIELDPNYAQAYAGLGFAYTLDYQNRWSDDPDGSLRLAKHYAEQAIEKNPKEPAARVVAAMVASREKRPRPGDVRGPNCTVAKPELRVSLQRSWRHSHLPGEPLEAIPLLERAMRLDPAHTELYLHFLGMAYLLAGMYKTAVTLFRAAHCARSQHGFFTRPACVRAWLPRRRRRGPAYLAGTHGDQSEILVQRAFRPATFPEARGCPEDRRRSCEGRIVDLAS